MHDPRHHYSVQLGAATIYLQQVQQHDRIRPTECHFCFVRPPRFEHGPHKNRPDPAGVIQIHFRCVIRKEQLSQAAPVETVDIQLLPPLGSAVNQVVAVIRPHKAYKLSQIVHIFQLKIISYYRHIELPHRANITGTLKLQSSFTPLTWVYICIKSRKQTVGHRPVASIRKHRVKVSSVQRRQIIGVLP